MEFTLKVKLGKNGAKNYSALESVVRGIVVQLAKLNGKRFKREEHEIEVLSKTETARFMAIGLWKIAPVDAKLSDRLLTVFPWLADDNETQVSGADTVDELQQLYNALIAEGR